MNNEQFIESITEFAASKKIDRPTVIRMLREALKLAIEKKFGSNSNFDIIIDPEKGALQIWRTRTIVEDNDPEVDQPYNISLTEACKKEADFEVGEEVVDEMKISMFNRRTVIEALNLFIREKYSLEQSQLYEHYNRLIGQLITAEVGYISNKQQSVMLYDSDKNELILLNSNKIPEERFRKEALIRVLVERIETNGKRIKIFVTRTSPLFVRELLTAEIPEIFDNIVQIMKIARDPGYRTKVIVTSQDDRIEPSGACIGLNGRRIQAIREHLGYERLDIISHTDNLALLIKRIVGLDKPIAIEESPEGIHIYPTSSQVSSIYENLPFLKELLELPIEIKQHPSKHKTSEHEDVHLDEFTNEIDQNVIGRIKRAGFFTAKSVLKIPPDQLIQKTELTPNTVNHLYQVLQEEFTN